jgi:hypothetical protein
MAGALPVIYPLGTSCTPWVEISWRSHSIVQQIKIEQGA